ncbi:hypothetical protein SAMN04487902_101569 [Prevotella sp. ne3005]|uniref:hypothetical protein n=1 Tax=Prevotella sp. ne3005 TaxID=1761887 RepID=UPI0008AAE0E8|nr:hypothetical protein [Prevotella sp. ne3005]SEM58034.1 hypothetical protein SAMN04487902_101569 [Prevotella sp. ne3005]
MKKKIINGILMAAMLFAGTTSFVSCKDNVDDVSAGIYKDMDVMKQNLLDRISKTNLRIDSLGREVDVVKDTLKNLRTDLIATQGRVNSLESRMKTAEDSIKSYNNRINAINDKIDDLIKNAIYDVKVEETIDAVIGTINIPGISIPTLFSYYGKNMSDLTVFPTTNPKVSAYYTSLDEAINNPNGQYLYDAKNGGWEKRTEETGPWIGKVKQIRFEDGGAQLAQYANNVGTIYFQMNPKSVDISNVKFDIVDSKGNVYPYEISDVKSSDHDLTIALGKHGEILNEGETDNAYLYQAKVHLPMAKWAQAISYNLDESWKLLGDMSKIKDMVEKVKAAKSEGGKTEASKVLVKEALQWLQNQYQKTYTNKYKMKYQALRATGKYNVATSATKILVAAVEPLSYKTFWELDANGKAAIKANVDVESIEKAVAALIKASGKKVSEIVKIKETGYQIETINGANVDVATLTQAQIKAIVSNIPYANNVLAKLKKVYHASSSDDIAALQASASNFLSKVSAKIASVAGDHYFFNTVAPIVLFKNADEGDESMYRLSPGLHIKTNGHKMNLILTSPTEEYLVPAMYKYIAVRHNDEIVDAKLISGQQKVIDLDVKYDGECEIIYQTVDYSGYVVSKTYPITVE